MNATIPMLLVSTLITAFAPRSVAQEPGQPKVGSRRPVDVSVEGVGQATRRAPGDIPQGGSSIGFLARPSADGLDTPLDCLESIADQATGSCLTASSTPTLGMLYPYPGLNNVFVPQAFVGGGENNQATGSWSTIGGGYRNTATGYGIFGLVGQATVGGGASNTASGYGATVGGGGGATRLSRVAPPWGAAGATPLGSTLRGSGRLTRSAVADRILLPVGTPRWAVA